MTFIVRKIATVTSTQLLSYLIIQCTARYSRLDCLTIGKNANKKYCLQKQQNLFHQLGFTEAILEGKKRWTHYKWVSPYCWLNTMYTLLSRYRYFVSFVSWCCSFLGWRIWVVLPAFVVLWIRTEFPDTQARYVRFGPVRDWTSTCSWLSLPASLVVRTGQIGIVSTSSTYGVGFWKTFSRWGLTVHPRNLE